MSHIPSTAMPHARADGDDLAQQDGARPEPEPTTATPRQAEPVIGANTADEPLAVSATERAQDMAAAGPSADDEPPLSSAAPGTSTGARDGTDADRTAQAASDDGRRSAALLAAMVLGGLAAIGGLVAAALPLIRERDDRKGKKGKRKAKNARD